MKISGCAAIGAFVWVRLAATSGPGVCAKSEAMNLAVITRYHWWLLMYSAAVATGLPTKSEQKQIYCRALFGVTGESPYADVAANSLF